MSRDSMIDILYFARLRERLGRGRDRIDLPPAVVRAGNLVTHLRERGAYGPNASGRGRRS